MTMAEQMENAVGHNIKMIDMDDKVWHGWVSGFTTEADNEEDDEPGYFSMDLDVKNNDGTIDYYEIRESEIKSIEVLV